MSRTTTAFCLGSLVLLGLVLGVVLAAPAVSQDREPDFDHTATRFVLTGTHESVPCEGCHGMGVFAGTPTDCSFCHDGSGMRAESGKPIDHVPTSNRCEDCHTSVTWLEVRFDHVAVSGRCVACHNGRQATGKDLGHITTNADCDLCHNTIIWDVVRFDHSGITEPCSSCHNGMEASGKPNDHLMTTEECDLCHSTRAWEPAMFDHTGITAPCSSCHNGMDATGLPNGHLPTPAECDLCHSTNRWRPANFDHSGVTGACSTCHNGMDATGIPNGHFITVQDCNFCHTTNRWRPDIFSHMSPNYPGDHAQDLDCTECHPGNSDPVVYTDDPGLAPDCAGCHRNDFKQGPHKKYENPDTKYTVEELKDCSGSCHVYTDPTMSQIKDTRNREHRVSDGNFD